MEERYSNKVRASRWFFYTALPSIFTYMLACIYDLILGFTIIQSLEKHFLEFILMVFAIAISIFGSAMNIERKITPIMKEIYVGVSVFCCFICLVFYGFLYYPSGSKKENIITILHIVFVIIALLIICLGIIFEIKADKIKEINIEGRSNETTV